MPIKKSFNALPSKLSRSSSDRDSHSLFRNSRNENTTRCFKDIFQTQFAIKWKIKDSLSVFSVSCRHYFYFHLFRIFRFFYNPQKPAICINLGGILHVIRPIHLSFCRLRRPAVSERRRPRLGLSVIRAISYPLEHLITSTSIWNSPDRKTIDFNRNYLHRAWTLPPV